MPLAAVTHLSSDEEQPLPQTSTAPPFQMRRAAAKEKRQTLDMMFKQSCHCSSKSKGKKDACFLKFKSAKPKLEVEKYRESFQGLHKLDQDQLALWNT